MNCPLCVTPMRRYQYEGISVESCDACGGEFLDAAELGHVVRAREARFTPELCNQLADQPPVFGIPVDATDRHMQCPKCSAAMMVLNYCGDSGIYLDRCDDCGGFWLDSDELELVQIFQEEWESKAPGMIQEVAADLERARRELAEQTTSRFCGSRFAFVNALINRFLDAA